MDVKKTTNVPTRAAFNVFCRKHRADSKYLAGVVLKAVVFFLSMRNVRRAVQQIPRRTPSLRAQSRGLKASIDWCGFRQMVLTTGDSQSVSRKQKSQ